MVQFSNVFTIMLAGSSIASASYGVKNSASGKAAQADANAAVASFQNLISVLSNNIGSDDQLAAYEIKSAFQGYMGMLQSVSNFQLPPSMPVAANATPFVPNWEGAAIGGAALGIQGLITGALVGVTTQWTFNVSSYILLLFKR